MSSVVSPAGRQSGAVVICCIGLLVGSAAFAEDTGWDRFTLTMSSHKASIDTQIRLDASDLVPGTDLDLEDDLQLDDSDRLTQYYASLQVTDHISLEGSYFEFGRSVETVLNGSIRFGDTVFPVNVDATTRFAADAATVGLRWAFLRSDKLEVAATASAFWMSLAAGIDSTDAGLTELAEADSVLPMAGLYFGWNLTPKWQFTLNGDYVSIDYTDFEGSLVNLRASLRYLILSKVGLGVGYDALEIDVESENSDFSGRASYRQQGPKAFMSVRF